MDQHVDGIALHLLAPAINLLLDLRAREDHSRPLHQHAQHRKLARGQNVLLPYVFRFMGSKVQRYLSAKYPRLSLAMEAPHHGPYARKQLAKFERLDDVVVRA